MNLLYWFLGSPVVMACALIAVVASGALLFITNSLKFDARQYKRLGDKRLSDSNDDAYGVGAHR